MTHEENNIGGRAELPGSDEQKVSRLLSSLKRVEAPKDFDFHLKARIAKGRPSEVRTGSLFPILKFAAPLVLFLVGGAGIMFIGFSETGVGPMAVAPPAGQEPGPTAPTATGSEVPRPPETAAPPSNTLVAGSPAETGVPFRDNTPIRRDPLPGVRPRNEPSPDGSRDLTGGNSRVSNEISVANSNSQKIANLDSTVKTDTVGDALKTMGIDVELDGNTWAVKNVSAGSIGGGMGVKPGDRIEAIDGKTVDGNTTFKGKFSARSISVRRDGNLIDLKP